MLVRIIAAICLLMMIGCSPKAAAPEHLRVIFTSDTQGNFTPCGCAGGPRGGMQRRATAIAEARASSPGPSIVVDTGNFMTGDETDVERVKADFVAKAMAHIGYDAVNIGHLDAKRPRLAVQGYNKTDQGFPETSAAFTYKDQQTGQTAYSYPSRLIVNVKGFKIGIVGHPLDNLGSSKFGVENDFNNNPQEFYKLIDDILIKDGAKIVIVVTDFTGSWQEAKIVASRVPLASLVIAGSSAPVEFTEDNSGKDVTHPVIIPRAMAWGRSLGVLDLDLNQGGAIVAYKLRYIDINDSIQDDPSLSVMTAEYIQAINKEPTGVPELRAAGYVGSAACRDCHLPEYESWQKTPHANAWATLENAGRLSEAACIPCHSTGYSQSGAFPSRMVPFDSRNVGCESCHGPGQVHIDYRKYKIYGQITGQSTEAAQTDPIVKTPLQDTCLKCHVAPYDEGWLYIPKLNRVKHQ